METNKVSYQQIEKANNEIETKHINIATNIIFFILLNTPLH